MLDIVGETFIYRSVDDVVAFLVDERNHPTWDPELAGIARRFLGDAGPDVGRRFDVFEYDSPERLTRLIRYKGSVRSQAMLTWTFEALPEGTWLQARMRIEVRGMLRLLVPLFGPALKKRSSVVLANITRSLERGELPAVSFEQTSP
jgi:hypothetical protein